MFMNNNVLLVYNIPIQFIFETKLVKFNIYQLNKMYVVNFFNLIIYLYCKKYDYT